MSKTGAVTNALSTNLLNKATMEIIPSLDGKGREWMQKFTELGRKGMRPFFRSNKLVMGKKKVFVEISCTSGKLANKGNNVITVQ